MADEIPEAKDFDQVADELLDKVEKETPSSTSDEIKPEGTETEITKPAGAEPEKTEQVKAVEEDESLSVEDKLAKVKEILGDDEKAIDAYVKEKGYHNDPAWQKQREIIDRLKQEKEEGTGKVTLSEEDSDALEEFKKFRSSAEYIQTSMKTQGYTQDAIDIKLKETGFDIPIKIQDDVQLVLDKLDIKTDDISPQDKANIMANVKDIVRVADVIVQDRLSKILPKELQPIQDHIGTMQQTESASKIMTVIKDTVKSEGILDFNEDVEPVLDKFLDDNPDANQQDIFEHFKSINHSLTIERLKTGKKKEERDEKKTHLRQNVSISGSPKGVPAKTGDFDKDANAFLDSVNYHE